MKKQSTPGKALRCRITQKNVSKTGAVFEFFANRVSITESYRAWRGRAAAKVGRALLPVAEQTGKSARPTEFAHGARILIVCSTKTSESLTNGYSAGRSSDDANRSVFGQ